MIRSTFLVGVRFLSAAWLAVVSFAAGIPTSEFDFQGFSSNCWIAMQGQARIEGTSIQLVSLAAGAVGAAWSGARRFVGNGFETEFQFRVTSSPANETPEGFAFVIQNNGIPGISSHGLGYSGIPRTLAFEFDFRGNSSTQDGTAAHLSFHTAGRLANSHEHTASFGSAVITNSLADGQAHSARIVYNATTISVYLDQAPAPLLTALLPEAGTSEIRDLETLLGMDDGRAWIGFTTASGDISQRVEILSWSFSPSPTPIAVSLALPPEGASFLCPGRIDLAASIGSAIPIIRVDFYQGTTKIGESTAEPWTFQWKEVIPGDYQLTAVATGPEGQRGVSPPVRVLVHPFNPGIGVHFVGPGTNGPQEMQMADLAGVVPQRLWNNVYSDVLGNGSAASLRTAGGAITTMRVTWDFAGVAADAFSNAGLNPDYVLMKSQLIDERITGGQTNSSIYVQRVPFPVYDVIVYVGGTDNEGESVTKFRLGGNTVFLRQGPRISFAGTFVEGGGPSDQAENTPDGNYVRFNSLTNADFQLLVTALGSAGSSARAGVTALQIVPSLSAAPLQVTRGPYLQAAGTTNMTIRWRTNRSTDSRVQYGLSLAAMFEAAADSSFSTEHIVVLTNLQPGTRYFYGIGTSDTNLVGGADYTFVTFPTNDAQTRVWFVSDFGFRNQGEQAIRDSYFNFIAPEKPADIWITGGDNDQTDGSDSHYQDSVFGTYYGYGALLRSLPVFPTIGNHDYQTGHGQFYYANFSMPTNGETGGVPSGSEHYYSFNHGNVHFISLDSVDGNLSRGTNSPMVEWLLQDLAANTQLWTIAYWHGGPYTKGTHDSDDDSDTLAWMTQMRTVVVPILEAFGVDLVLNGHSHVYERSWLMQGHYGYSYSFLNSMILDGGDGKPDGTGPFYKAGNQGTIYITAATGSNPQADRFPYSQHPAHLLKIRNTLGSVVLDIQGDQLNFKYVGADGIPLDYFTITKAPPTTPPATPARLTVEPVQNGGHLLTWINNATNENAYILERSTDRTNFNMVATIGANLTSYLDASPPSAESHYYRLRAINQVGSSDYSKLSVIGLDAPPQLLSAQCLGESVVLTWKSAPGRKYNIETTLDLARPAWVTIGDSITADGTTTTWAVPRSSGQPSGYYRVFVREN